MRKFFISTGIAFTLFASLLAGCGGGGGGAVGATAAATSGNAGITGVSTQVETALSFSLDGLDAGVYGLPKPPLAMVMASSFESPQAASHAVPTCSNGSAGTATKSQVLGEDDISNLVYNNCVVDGSTLNGTITISGPREYTSNGVWTATYSGFSVSGEGTDGKVVKFNYAGSQVIKDLVWAEDNSEAVAAKVTMNVDINVDNGSSTIKFTNYLINFSYNATRMETSIDMSGKFAFDLKLADFGVPVTPGLPATVNVEFDVTTPTTLKFTETTDSGVYKLTSLAYTLEIDYTNDVAKFTAGGVTQTFPLAP